MRELTVSLQYQIEASPPGTVAPDVALPLRVLDADGGVVVEGAASRSKPAHFNVGTAEEPLFVRLTWPSGKTETKRVEGPQLVFDDNSISRHEWAAWAVPRLSEKSSLVTGVQISEKTGNDPFAKAWLRLWQFKESKWSAVALAPVERYRSEDAIQLDFSLDRSGWCLQLGGTDIPWIMISLPPGGPCRVLITRNPSRDPRKEPLKVVVTGFRSDTETLLEFLSRDSLRAAHAVSGYEPLAIKLLAEKFEDPVAAAAGAYFLLRTGGWGKIHRYWFENLDFRFPWIADGAIIHCAVLTRSGLPNPTAVKGAVARLGESLQRGIPVFAEGLSLLHEAASVLRPQATDIGVFAMIDRLTAASLWAGAAFTFSGENPSAPSPKRRRGTPPRERSPRIKSTPSIMLLRDIPLGQTPGAAEPTPEPKSDKPNILILLGDDIGWWNISYNSRGQMGYRTPNIDRVANEGVAFTDYYGQQSCTAGRAAFITGQNPIRTGLTKVGMPGADVGLSAEDPTIAELLKPLGYMTGQFGKNHLGDKDQFLPTQHGFDEFFGNLYHLNAEEEPEDPDYPKDPEYKKRFGPRGVLHCKADGKGGQTVEDTGPLTKKRMETIDDEVTTRTLKFIDEAHKAKKPFFVWYNTTGMHFRTHPAAKHKGKSNGQGDYNDVMVAHDEHIGQMLNKLDELGIAENTIVMYSTDNGPHYNTWPDAGITPFRSEKNTNWEGGWRVPAFVRWPAKFKAGTVLNGIVSHQDWLPTLLAAAGEADVSAKLLEGYKIGKKTYKVHIDGLNMLPYLSGQVKVSPRKFFFYMSDDGDILGIRMEDWKVVLMEQRAKQLLCWFEPFVHLSAPKMFNLRRDPFERADENSNTYWDWVLSHAYILYGMQALVAGQIANFEKFPPRQKPASFNLDAVMRKLAEAQSGANQ